LRRRVISNGRRIAWLALGLALALPERRQESRWLDEDSITQKLNPRPDGVFQRSNRGMKFDCVIASCASFERSASGSASATGKFFQH